MSDFSDDENENVELLIGRSVHELRSPLASLRNTLHWLQKALRDYRDNPRVLEKLRNAVLDAETISHVIDTMALYRRVPVNSEFISTSVFADVISENLDNLRSRLARLGIERDKITIETSGVHKIPPLKLNRERMETVIRILIDNSVKYRKPNGRFQLRFVGEVRLPEHSSVRMSGVRSNARNE